MANRTMFIYWKPDGDYILVDTVNGNGVKVTMTRLAFNDFKLWWRRLGFTFVLKS